MYGILNDIDTRILLQLNFDGGEWFDHFMMRATHTSPWICFFLTLLICLGLGVRNAIGRARSFPVAILYVCVCIALLVLVCDQFSSSVCKEYFCRPRPSHECALEGVLHIVNGYRGGPYGFFSSHAANTFGISAFIAFMMRNRIITLSVYLWAVISTYSRIYLGVHYPGDIIVGILFGTLMGYFAYRIALCVIKSHPTYTSCIIKGRMYRLSILVPVSLILTILVLWLI